MLHIRRMEVQDDSIPRFARVIIQQTTEPSGAISTSNHKRPTGTSRTRSGHSRPMATTQRRSTLPARQHVTEQRQQYADRTCSAMVSRHGDNYTYVTRRHLVQELPHQTTQTTTRRKQVRRELYNMGVSTRQVRTRQQNTTTGCSQDCNPAQRDKRSTTTAFATTSRQYRNLRTNQITGCGVSQSSITIRQTTSGYE